MKLPLGLIATVPPCVARGLVHVPPVSRGRTADAFARLPSVQPVPRADDPQRTPADLTAPAQEDLYPLEHLAAAEGRPVFDARFDGPAHFPLPQFGNFRKSFTHAGRAMDAGFHVLVFPEGRHTPDGRIHSFQAGGNGRTGPCAKNKLVPIEFERMAGTHVPTIP